MSLEVFPSLPGLDIEIIRETEYATMILTAASGKEIRGTRRSARPRYLYTLTFNCLRQIDFDSALVQDEVAILQGFFDRHRGRFDSFLLDDPVDDERRRVRWDNDTMELARVVDLCYASSKVAIASLL